jgi:hypothetical protein
LLPRAQARTRQPALVGVVAVVAIGTDESPLESRQLISAAHPVAEVPSAQSDGSNLDGCRGRLDWVGGQSSADTGGNAERYA